MIFLILLIAYSLLITAFGAIISRSVRVSSDFFVAGRNLSPVLVFSLLHRFKLSLSSVHLSSSPDALFFLSFG